MQRPGKFCVFVKECPWLVRALCQKIQQLLVIHAIQSVYVDAESVRDAFHIQAEALEQFDEVHFLARIGIMKLGAAMITLRPSTALDQTEMAALDALPFARRYYRPLRPGAVKHGRVVVGVILFATFAAS